MLERLELSLSTCSEIHHHVEQLHEYASLLIELIDCLKSIYQKWRQYGEVLDSYPLQDLSHQVPTCASSTGLGRPRFHITKDQLEYLSSMGFKWKEIAALLGVSRMTIYITYITQIFNVYECFPLLRPSL